MKQARLGKVKEVALQAWHYAKQVRCAAGGHKLRAEVQQQPGIKTSLRCTKCETHWERASDGHWYELEDMVEINGHLTARPGARPELDFKA